MFVQDGNSDGGGGGGGGDGSVGNVTAVCILY